MIKRKGWTARCPVCGEYFLYTKFNNPEPTPFFYCDRRSDVLLRESDQELVRAAYKANQSSTEQLKRLWDTFVESSPICLCGGKFGFWTYISCPNCHKELPHPTASEFISVRIQEPSIIIIDGHYVIGDTAEESYQVLVSLD